MFQLDVDLQHIKVVPFSYNISVWVSSCNVNIKQEDRSFRHEVGKCFIVKLMNLGIIFMNSEYVSGTKSPSCVTVPSLVWEPCPGVFTEGLTWLSAAAEPLWDRLVQTPFPLLFSLIEHKLPVHRLKTNKKKSKVAEAIKYCKFRICNRH